MRRHAAAAKAEAGGRTEGSLVAWRVHRALEELQPHEREAIELTYWSGMSHGDVAGYLGLPPTEVGTSTRNALAHLASILEGEAR